MKTTFFAMCAPCASEGFDESAINEEVGPGDIACATAREDQGEVGDLGGLGESSRRESALAGDHLVAGGVEVDAETAGGCRCDAVLSQPQLRGHRPRADGVEADALRPELLRERLR